MHLQVVWVYNMGLFDLGVDTLNGYIFCCGNVVSDHGPFG